MKISRVPLRSPATVSYCYSDPPSSFPLSVHNMHQNLLSNTTASCRLQSLTYDGKYATILMCWGGSKPPTGSPVSPNASAAVRTPLLSGPRQTNISFEKMQLCWRAIQHSFNHLKPLCTPLSKEQVAVQFWEVGCRM